MARYVSLLRGINVGGARIVKMAELRDLHRELGHEDVQSYVQSGNVVFDTEQGDADELAGRIHDAIAVRFGYDDVDVVLRTRTELAEAAAANPFLARGCDLATLHLMLLRQPIESDRLAGLDGVAYLPDEFALAPRQIYLHLPDGAGRTKLFRLLSERRLGTRATVRNWRTVIALLDLLAESTVDAD